MRVRAANPAIQPISQKAFVSARCQCLRSSGCSEVRTFKTTGEIKKGPQLGVGVAHSDADQGFPLVTPDELQGGAGLFPVLHQQIEGEGTTEDISFGNPF